MSTEISAANKTIKATQPMNGSGNGEAHGIRKWLPLGVLSMALMIIILDTTILNVSLRTIIHDLNTDIESIQWVITAYSLMLAAFTITGGRMGDLFGKKKMFMAGAVVFAIGSFMTSIAHTVSFMIWGEAIIEGIGAALMMPATASLLVSNYKGRDRQIGFGIWGGIAAASAALGPVFGGWLTTDYSWRWAFRINVVVAAVLVALAFLIKEDREGSAKKPGIDYTGVVLSALGLLSIVFGLIKSTDYGWWKAKEQLVVLGHTLNLGTLSVTPLFVAVGLAILAIFIFWEAYVQRKGGTPLVSPMLFKNKQFTTATAVIGIMSLGLTGLSFTLPVFFQVVKNLDPLHTGFAMLPMSLTLLVFAPLSAFISKYISPKHLIQAGLVLVGAGFWVLHLTFKVDGSQWQLAPGMMLFGAGMGMIMSQSNNMALSAVSVRESGEASGVSNTLRQLGATLGAAILGAILISTLTTNLVGGVNKSSVIPDALKPGVANAVQSQSSNVEFGNGVAPIGTQIPDVIATEITNISHQAAVDANRTTEVYALMFVVLAFIISFLLPAKIAEGGAPMEASAGDAGIVTGEAEAPLQAPVVLAEVQPVRRNDDHDDSDKEMEPGSSRPGGGLGPVIFGLVLVAIAAAAGYEYGKFRNNQDSKNQQATQNPAVLGTDTQPDTSSSNSSANQQPSPTTQPAPAPTPAPAPAPAPSPKPTAPTLRLYSNRAMHFQVKVPSNFKISVHPNEVLFSGSGKTFSIQVYDVGTQTSLGFTKSKLEQLPNIHDVQTTTLNGKQALTFKVDGIFGRGWAFVENGRLYYLMGSGITTALPGFQTI